MSSRAGGSRATGSWVAVSASSPIYLWGKESDKECNCHIVLVHGLFVNLPWFTNEDDYASSYATTWKSPSGGAQDPEGLAELLQRQYPKARIYSVRWDSRARNSVVGEQDWVNTTSYVKDELLKAGIHSRPVVFIAHSMGGLLVKAILDVVDIAARKVPSQPKCEQLLANLEGVIFIATPHQGSRLQEWVEFFENRTGLHICSPLVAILGPTSVRAEYMRRDFATLVDCLRSQRDLKRTRTFSLALAEMKGVRFKNLPSSLMSSVIVDTESAGAGMDETVPINADHIEISKPGSGMIGHVTKYLDRLKDVFEYKASIIPATVMTWKATSKTKGCLAIHWVLVEGTMMAPYLKHAMGDKLAGLNKSSVVCLGTTGGTAETPQATIRVWHQQAEAFHGAYNVKKKDAIGWMECMPKKEIGLQYCQVTEVMWEGFPTAQKRYILAKDSALWVEGVGHLVEVPLNSYLLRRQATPTDQWVVEDDYFKCTYDHEASVGTDSSDASSP